MRAQRVGSEYSMQQLRLRAYSTTRMNSDRACYVSSDVSNSSLGLNLECMGYGRVGGYGSQVSILQDPLMRPADAVKERF